MFGTLKLNRCTAGKEYGKYKKFYCGLCLQLAREYGSSARLLLNYDTTFLYILLTALTGSRGEEKDVSCPVAPFRKRIGFANPETAQFVAAVNIYLAGMKLRDDIRDGAGPSRRAAYKLLLSRQTRAAAFLQEHGLEPARAEELFQRQMELEQTGGSLAELTRPTAEGLSYLFSRAGRSFDLDEDSCLALGQVGSALGQISYVVDSFVDYPTDLRCGRFNALAEAFGDRITLEQSLPADVRSHLLQLLENATSQLEEGIESLNLGQERQLVDAIIHSLRQRVNALVTGTETMQQVEERAKKATISYRLTHPSLLLRSRSAARRRRAGADCCCADDLCTAWICCDAADCDCDTAEGCAEGDCCEFMECCG